MNKYSRADDDTPEPTTGNDGDGDGIIDGSNNGSNDSSDQE